MNRTALSVVALAVGAVLIIGLYNIYSPQVHGMTHDVFDKIHIQRMVGGNSNQANTNKPNLRPSDSAKDPHRGPSFGVIYTHYVDVSHDPQGKHLSTDPEPESDTVLPSSGTNGNSFVTTGNANASSTSLSDQAHWRLAGVTSNPNLTFQHKTPQDFFVGILPK